MRMFSLLGRAAVRSPFVFGSTARAALPHFNVLPLVAAAGVISVLAQPPEAAECMGKRKKKDSVLEDDMYEVDYIKARKLEKGKPLYLIRWKGFDDDKYDTWEPLENLSGFEPDISAFEAKQKKDNEEFARQLAERKASRQQATGKDKAKAGDGTAGSGDDEDVEGGEGSEGNSAGTIVKQEGAKTGRRMSPFWNKVLPGAQPGEYICQEPTPSGGICGAKLHPGAGATVIKRHFEGKHKRTYQELMGYLDADVVDVGAAATDGAQPTIKAQPFSEERKAECNMACARWLVKSVSSLSSLHARSHCRSATSRFVTSSKNSHAARGVRPAIT